MGRSPAEMTAEVVCLPDGAEVCALLSFFLPWPLGRWPMQEDARDSCAGGMEASERVSVVVFALRLRMSLTAPLAAPCGFCLTWVLREEF